jgi:hypothetical protein
LLPANGQCQIATDNQRIDVGLESNFPILEVWPVHFRVVEIRPALFVEERGLFEMLFVELDVEFTN